MELVRLSFPMRPTVIIGIDGSAWRTLVPNVLAYETGGCRFNHERNILFFDGHDADRAPRLMFALHRAEHNYQRSIPGHLAGLVFCGATLGQARVCEGFFDSVSRRAGTGRVYNDCFADERTAKVTVQFNWERIRE